MTIAKKMKPVSLSGDTRLTFLEAAALLDFIVYAMADDRGDEPAALEKAAERGLSKLKRAIEKAGGYDDDGHFIDPFRK